MSMIKSDHKWRFFKTCRLEQVALRSGADIANLKHLDQKLWTALSCPVKGIRYDEATLKFLDADGDGRVRVPEILAAVEWLEERLVSLDSLIEGGESVSLGIFDEESSEGSQIKASARRILENLGKGDATAITLADVSDTAAIFAQTNFNGDGVVPADAAESEGVKQTISDIIECCGAEEDRSGKPGVNQAKVDDFFAAVKDRIGWLKQSEEDKGILFMGEKTAGAFGALKAVRDRIDDFFTRCRLAAYDQRAAQVLNAPDADLSSLAEKALNDHVDDLAEFPLATVTAEGVLNLESGLNPYWADAMAEFRGSVLAELDGEGAATLSVERWREIKALFGPYEAWQGADSGGVVAGLSVERLRELKGGDHHSVISELIARDAALESENAQIADVERLIRYHANLDDLLNNYVNMGRLYDPERLALFQVGTLYLDARACNLCFEVESEGAHSALAEASKCSLAYCTLTRPGAAPRTICAVFTAGFSSGLWVGRNGIFYDIDGKDWDATIVKMVENPLSLREAFWDPWRKIAAMISGQVNKMLSARQDAALAAATEGIDAASEAPAEAPKKMEGAALASSVAALGIAVGLVGSAIGSLLGVMAGLPAWKIVAGVLAVMLLVSGPSVILAWFKLRARDLAAILNAGGWAVNRPLHFSMRMARLFTSEASLPDGAVRELNDPYADKNGLRNTIVVLVILAIVLGWLWSAGKLDSMLPEGMQRIPEVAEEAVTGAGGDPATELAE